MKKRSDRQIQAAMSEFLDRVWYERKLVLIQNLKNGTETIDPEIKKGMLASMKKCEAKYGGKKGLRVEDAFEWGMINGKLSTLRWVMGEDWDELYT